MKIEILTLFPESFSYLDESIIKRARQKGIIEINIVDIRSFSKDKHKKCDDYPFGGGAGMLMSVQPIYDAVKSVQTEKSKIIMPSPSGKLFNGETAKNLAKEEHLIFICGHYEGVDQRVSDIFKPQEISIGDYVLTGGELASMVIIDALARQIDGVITKESLDEESFDDGNLEYPQYTRPQDFLGYKVPDVLVSGNHQEVAKWRKEQALKRTNTVRPDLIKNNDKN